MEAATTIDGNTGYFPSFEVLTNSKMESVVGNDNSVNSSSSHQQEQNSFDAGLSEAQDALLSIIEQQSNRSPDEYRSALVPFGEILRDIYETSNQTLNLTQHNNNDIQSTTTNFEQESINNNLNQQQMPSTFHVNAPYQQQQQQQQNQGFSSNYNNNNNSNIMNYLNPFNNSFNFYQNYQQPNNNCNNSTQFNSIYSTAITNPQQISDEQPQQQHQQIQQQCKYDDYNQNIETLIETVYEDENDQNPVYLNFNVTQSGNGSAGPGTVTIVDNQNNIPVQNTNYPFEQSIYPGIYQTQQSSTFNNQVNNKLWYPESIINNCNNNNENIINRNIINQTNYIQPSEYHPRIQNNTNLPIRKLSHSNQSAFDTYRNGKTPYQKYNNKNKSYIDSDVTTTTNYHFDQNSNNNNYLLSKPQKNYQYVQEQFIPIGRNLQLQPNQKFITSDMISCRPPIQTKRTVATTITIKHQQQSQQQHHQQQQQQQTQLSVTTSSLSIPETCNSIITDNNDNNVSGFIVKELTNTDISGIDFSSLDTSDIIIQKIEPKLGEPLHKKRKQELKILDGSENVIFEFIDFTTSNQHQQQNDIDNQNKLITIDHENDDIEKNLKNILNSPFSDDEQDDDNNNINNCPLNIIKTNIPNQDEIPLSKLKVKKIKISKENLKSSSSSQQHHQQTITQNNNNIQQSHKKQKRTLLKKTKIECCFDNNDETCSSDSDFEEFLLKNKSFKCNKCNKMFKSSKTLSTHRKRCNNNNIEQKKTIIIDNDKLNYINKNNDEQLQQQQINNTSCGGGGGYDSEHDDDPNSYPVEYLDSDSELNDTKNQTIDTNITGHNNNNTNEDQQQIIKETIEIDLENNEDNFRRKTRSQTKRKNVELNYYESSQKFPVKRKK